MNDIPRIIELPASLDEELRKIVYPPDAAPSPSADQCSTALKLLCERATPGHCNNIVVASRADGKTVVSLFSAQPDIDNAQARGRLLGLLEGHAVGGIDLVNNAIVFESTTMLWRTLSAMARGLDHSRPGDNLTLALQRLEQKSLGV